VTVRVMTVAAALLRRLDRRLRRHVEDPGGIDRRVEEQLERRREEQLEALRRELSEARRALADAAVPDERRLKVSPSAVKGGVRVVAYLIDLCRLKPHEAVLEIGCGGGGPALHLAKVLNEEGSYDGLDIQEERIERCTRVISAKYPNFRFHVADVYNGNYNPKGTVKASEYRFPFDDESFDVVFLNSVFTHMLPGDVERYLSEVSRVLRRGGRCLITYFLMNPESLAAVQSGTRGKSFPYAYGNHRVESEDSPDRLVALDEGFVRGLYDRFGLEILEPIRYGRWSGRKTFTSKQDIIVAVKPEGSA
jgi:SAM-dependent methyltransferase